MEDKVHLYEKFKEKLIAVAGECYCVKTAQEAAALIKDVLKAKGVKSVVMTNSPLSQAAALDIELKASGLKVFKNNFRENAPNVDAGITQVNWAIAEIGTLVQDGTNVDERLCSALPPIHVALVQKSALIPTLMETMATIHKLPQIPGFIGFITGPSRTSDIERVLTIGVHGPAELVTVFVDEEIGR